MSAICNKVLILSHGKLVAYDTPKNLEKRALGSGVLSVTAIGSQEAVREALCNIFQDSDISFAACEEAGSVCAHISGVSQNDRRAEVSLALASKGIAVTDLHLESLSLEDVFLELTQTDVSAPSPDETDDSLELIDYLDYYNNRRIKAKLKGLPPAIHRQQALSAA